MSTAVRRVQMSAQRTQARIRTRDRSLGERLDDAALLAKIRTALHLDKEVRKLVVDVRVSSGQVILRGEIPSEVLMERIRTRVASVRGVEGLEDELELKQ